MLRLRPVGIAIALGLCLAALSNQTLATSRTLAQTPKKVDRSVLVKQLRAMAAKSDYEKFAWGTGPCNVFAADLPAGLQLTAGGGQDAWLLDVARSVERLLKA